MRRFFVSSTAVVALAVSCGTASAAVIIDDFTSDEPNVIRPADGPGEVFRDEVDGATNTLNGTRYVGLTRQGGTVTGTVGGGSFAFTESAQLDKPAGQGGFDLAYDGTDDNLPGSGDPDLVTDLTDGGENGAIQIIASSTDLLRLRLRAYSGNSVYEAFLDIAGDGLKAYYVNFAAFNLFSGIPTNFAEATKAFRVTSVPNAGVTTDVQIDSIAAVPAVPEPGTLALLATGLGGLALRVRRRRTMAC